ncbi:hypothetical protein CKY47_35320 [Saccharothrix yanglingensis]|uniref:Uncharacterized protein n=1 Tax=Saccharothrix yanglingensis TaxID=659496 RepID=A0ABU0XAF3_9PSEU|nr:hypothetical protein [Saccharothrix yanglingensis]
MAACTPAALVVPALVRNLAELTDADVVYCQPTPRGLAVATSWPRREPGHVLAADLAGLAALPDVAAEPVAGGGGLLVAAPGRGHERDRQALRETAVWVGVAIRLEGLRAARDRAAVRAARLDAELASARERLAEVRDLERRRLVGAITALAGRDFADVRERVERLGDAFTTRAVEELKDGLDGLLDTFRTAVRGVHPAMLPDRGPRAALEELVAVLRRPVRFGGDLGRRVGWEVESGFYHAAAAVLNLVAAENATTPVAVDFARAHGELAVDVTAPGWTAPVERLRADLADDAARLAVLGGRLACTASEGSAHVSIRLPERIGPAPADGAEDGPAHRLRVQVHDLVELGWWAASPGDRDRWAAVADDLGRAPRLAVVGPGRRAVVGALLGGDAVDAGGPVWYAYGQDAVEPRRGAEDRVVVRRRAEVLRGLTVLDVPGAAEQAVARLLAADPGTGAPTADAVLCLAPPTAGFRAELRLGRHRVDVIEPGAVLRPALALVASTLTDERYRALRAGAPEVGRLTGDELRVAVAAARDADSTEDLARVLARESGLVELRRLLAARLLVRADLIAARRGLVSATEAVRALPGGHPMRWEVERVRAAAHEVVELDLLDEVERSAIVPPDLRDRVLRLLGAHGPAAHTRLDLPPGADAQWLGSAARAEAEWWRARGGHPATSSRVREVCEVLVRSCEGLVWDGPPGAPGAPGAV